MMRSRRCGFMMRSRRCGLMSVFEVPVSLWQGSISICLHQILRCASFSKVEAESATTRSMPQKYKRPPITEAVISVGIRAPLDADKLAKIHKRLLDRYPAPTQRVVSQFDVEITENGPKINANQAYGYKMQSGDGAEVALIFPNQIVTSRLAPYEGWEALFARAQENWEIWKRLAGWHEISRVGVRYINRLDIPDPESAPIRLEDYLMVNPRMPQGEGGLPPMTHFVVNTVTPLGRDDCRLVLNISNVPSPLVKTASFALDIDIANEQKPPQNDEGIWQLLARIREYKNEIFESCITDKARALFS